jgi:hypothetical protein
MPPAIRDESMFPFFRQGTLEASTIGSWARVAFLPPDMFQALLSSLIGEWLEAGADPSAAAVAEAVALAAYRGDEASALSLIVVSSIPDRANSASSGSAPVPRRRGVPMISDLSCKPARSS